MPTVKDYSKTKKARRRPGREETDANSVDETDLDSELEANDAEVEQMQAAVEEELKAIPSEEDTQGNHNPHSEHTGASHQDESSDRKKIHIEFPYSELVRSKVPKAFEVAENVAEEWVNNGNFENIPVGHPLAQITVAAGLRKAKEVEKKLEEKGVFMMAKMGLEYAKSKLNKK